MVEQILQAFLYPFLFLSLYFQVLLLISFFEGKKKIKKEEHREPIHFPTVTVAVPCWNEEKTLAGTLDSLLKLDYPHDKLSIIVVDDGSRDNTLAIARAYEAKHQGVIRVIAKENGGKHTAVNMALAESQSDLFGCLDADSFVAPKTLRTIVSYFEHDKEVMAVTPCIHVRHPKTFVQRIQAIEYLMGVFLRKAYGELDAIQVTPGPFSIFRKEVFERIGPYHKAHNTEDFEITLRMHREHLKIVNSHKALVYTVGPATAHGYFHQRLRWARGFLENSLDYRELFFKKKYGNLGLITLPFAFLFVFYTVYVAFVAVYSFINEMSNVVSRWLTVGIHPSVPTFDMFYFNTQAMSFVAMIMFMLFLVVLYIGNTLSSDRQQFYKNFPFFIVLYPIFVPLFLGRALFDTFTHRKNEWVLQDTKK